MTAAVLRGARLVYRLCRAPVRGRIEVLIMKKTLGRRGASAMQMPQAKNGDGGRPNETAIAMQTLELKEGMQWEQSLDTQVRVSSLAACLKCV